MAMQSVFIPSCLKMLYGYKMLYAYAVAINQFHQETWLVFRTYTTV